jgi:Base plate wedge protein 53
MDPYFRHFPLTSYNNTSIVDISRRVSISEASHNIPNFYYPVELNAGMRPDVLADAYYKDSELDWLLYLSNQIVDPYYEWYMSNEEFERYILEKYGDYDLPRKKIKFWRSNWATDETEITPSFYENNLSLDQKAYYSPVYGGNGKIMAFRRKPVDWTTNTNKIWRYTVSYGQGTSFTVGEIVDIHAGGTVGAEIQGEGEVVSCNSSMVIVHNITGNALANTVWLKTIVGEDSGTVAVANAFAVLSENITNATGVFWGPVTYYDWEVERNESRKHIHVLNPDISLDTSNSIREKLTE